MVRFLKAFLGHCRPFVILVVLTTTGIAHADSQQEPKTQPSASSAEPKPLTRLGDRHGDAQSLVVNNNLTLREFLDAIASSSHTERHYAEMYFVGVLDTTEGVDWCSYKVVLPHSAASYMYTEAKKVVASRGNERASTVIRDILKEMSNCRSKK